MLFALRAPHRPRLAERLQNRLERVFSRLHSMIREVRAILRDSNGPKGGVDQHASVALELHDGRVVFAEAWATSPGEALTRAATRARRAALSRITRHA